MSVSDFGAEASRIIRARSGGACEGCGRAGVRLELHHRLYRSRGGMGGAANGLALCGFGNASGCHGRAHSGDGKQGWALASGVEPEQAPVVLARFTMPVLLSDSGLVITAQGWACWQHLGGVPQRDCGECSPAGRVMWDVDYEKGWML